MLTGIMLKISNIQITFNIKVSDQLEMDLIIQHPLNIRLPDIHVVEFNLERLVPEGGSTSDDTLGESQPPFVQSLCTHYPTVVRFFPFSFMDLKFG
jgi:hypothetical protein